MRITHRHRETRKSKVLNIPSYHIVRPPLTEGQMKQLNEITAKVVDACEWWLVEKLMKGESKELSI